MGSTLCSEYAGTTVFENSHIGKVDTEAVAQYVCEHNAAQYHFSLQGSFKREKASVHPEA